MTMQAGAVVPVGSGGKIQVVGATERLKHGKVVSPSATPLGERFSVLLEKERGVHPGTSPFQRSLEGFTENWSRSERKFEQLVQTVPPSVRGVVELQVLVNRLHLQSEILARSADGVASTVKRLQQMGSG